MITSDPRAHRLRSDLGKLLCVVLDVPQYCRTDPLSCSAVLQVFVLRTIGLAVAVKPGGLGTFEAAVASLVPPAVVVVVMVLRDEVNLTNLIRRTRGGINAP